MKFNICRKLFHRGYYFYDASNEIVEFDKFDASKASSEPIYKLESKAISIGAKASLTDMNGNELIFIEQEVLHFMPQYNIYINNEFVGKAVKKFNFIDKIYEVSELDYKVKGDFLGAFFAIKNSAGDTIANIARKVNGIKDKYQIEILDEENYLNILGVLMVIIKAMDAEEDASDSSDL